MIKTISFITDFDQPYAGLPIYVKNKLSLVDEFFLISKVQPAINLCIKLGPPLFIRSNEFFGLENSLGIQTSAERNLMQVNNQNFFQETPIGLRLILDSVGLPNVNLHTALVITKLYRSLLVFSRLCKWSSHTRPMIIGTVENLLQKAREDDKNISPLHRLHYSINDEHEEVVIALHFSGRVARLFISSSGIAVGEDLKKISDVFDDDIGRLYL